MKMALTYDLEITDDMQSGELEMTLAGSHVAETASAQLNSVQ